MKGNPVSRILLVFFFLILLAFLHEPHRVSAAAPTVWTGPLTTYTQPAPDPTQPANQDQLTANVALTRSYSRGLFNAVGESGYTHSLSPVGTEWAYGTLASYASLTYAPWETWAGGTATTHGSPPSTVGQNAVLHLIPDDIYLSIKFTSWGHFGGGFSYDRSTPPLVPEPSLFAFAGLTVAAFAFRSCKLRRTKVF